ncbi:hypothetical protein ACFL6M_01100 [Candidatus Eisenbacteria bacterium]|uniref:Uncharacterized protein n=1 Tax=Eiseniibacteriota bacterium TaxID=2212470 RepID=A0ABV6YIK0_UNCEI
MSKLMSVCMLIAVLSLCLGCSDDTSTAPTDDGNGDDDFTLQGSETIGTTGGVLTTEGFILTVPGDAFDDDHEIKLYASPDEKPFGDHCITNGFRLEGLPEDYSQPLVLAIKHDGTSTQNLAIGIGMETYVEEIDSVVVIYRLVEAEESDGFLNCTLPAPGTVNTRQRAGITARRDITPTSGHRYYTGVENHERFVQSEHFVVWMPTPHSQYTDALVQCLEEQHTAMVEAFGADFSGYDANFPLDVQVSEHVWSHVRAYFHHGHGGPILPILYVSPAALANPDPSSLGISVGEELLRVAQQLKIYPATDYDSDPAYYWFHAAVRQWSEEIFTDDPAFAHPTGIYANTDAPFAGFQAGARTGLPSIDGYEHAMGMSPVIKYLMSDPSFGRQGFVQLYNDVGQGTATLLALQAKLPAPYESWWPEFFRQYMTGELYPIDPSMFMALATASWDIISTGDTEAEFLSEDAGIGPYPDLSAKVFTVGISNLDFGASDVIAFTATSPTLDPSEYTIVLLAWKPGLLVYQGHARELQLGEIKTLTDDGFTQLVAVVVNSEGDYPFLESSDIDLRIELKAAEQVTRAEVWVQIMCRVRNDWPDGSSSEEDRAIVMGTFSVDLDQTGPDTFEAAWDEEDELGVINEGTIKIVLDPSRNEVDVLEIDYHYAYADQNADRIERVTARDIGRVSDYYEVEGSTIVADHVSSLTYISVLDDWTKTALYPKEDQYNKITVRLF